VQATRSDRAKLRRILRRTWTRPFDFPSETAFVRFLSPPLYARPAILARAGFFLRGVVPRASFGNWRKFRRTRCNLNGGSGFCCFVRLRAGERGCLLRRISRCNGCAFRVALWLAPLPRVRTSQRARLAAAHDAQRFCRSCGHRACPAFPMIRSKYVRRFTPGREAIGTMDVAPGSARSKASARRLAFGPDVNPELVPPVAARFSAAMPAGPIP